MDRRTVLKTGTALGIAAAVGLPARAFAAQNRSPLQPAAYLRLKPGAVRAAGWLATQLDKQVNGLSGHYPETSHFLQFDNTGWIHPNLGGWEEVPYWLRGFVDLGYVTGNATVLATANRWLDGVLATQATDGFFGPTSLRTALNGHLDPWPHMPMLHAIRSHADYTGDSRVDPFLTRYFAYLSSQPTGVFSEGWGSQRWGDMIDVLCWSYNRTGDASLLNLVRRIHANSANYVNNLPTLHNVNLAQGFREPAQFWALSGAASDRSATYNDYSTIQSTYGQFPGGGFAGDENARPGFGDPRQGFETCGIVEYMLSHEMLTRITGDPLWSDRTEELAFNSLPAAFDPAGRAVHYVTSANSIDLDNVAKTMGQFQNGFAMQSYRAGVDQYRCCPHNYGMGWPYFVEEMWLGTPDGGLCAALLGPCTVTSSVGSGSSVTIVENTTYPFSDTVTFTVQTSSPVAFPLSVRIPGWCSSPDLRVNGSVVTSGAGPRFARISRTWSNGDMVTLRLPMSPSVKTWPAQHNAVSVNYGALTFSLRISENWTQTGGSAQFPEYDVHAGSPWNYGLVPGAVISSVSGGNVNDPFTAAGRADRDGADPQCALGQGAGRAQHVDGRLGKRRAVRRQRHGGSPLAPDDLAAGGLLHHGRPPG